MAVRAWWLALAAWAPSVFAAGDTARPGPRRAEQLYQQVCARCHETRVGPVLLGRGLPSKAIEVIVRDGRAAMPAFRESEITPTELAALATYVQNAPEATR